MNCRFLLKCFHIVSEDATIEASGTVRNLGIIVSTDLSWTRHINTIVGRARGVSLWVLSVFRSRESYVMMTLYKSLVRSHLEYCCPLWHPTKIKDIEVLECVQREFTGKIDGLQSVSY